MVKEQTSASLALLGKLREYDTCRIANAIETLGIRLRNEGFTHPGLKALAGSETSAIGYAVTARFKSSEAPLTGGIYSDRTDWWDHVVAVESPRIAVFEDIDEHAGRGAFLGEVHAEILKALGCAGAITNGSVRDLPAIRRAGFPIFGQSTSVSHAYVHLVEYGVPVHILGLTIAPGDLIYVDCHGALSIPFGVANLLPDIAAKQAQRERRVIDLCRSPEFSLDRLRAEVSRKS